MNCQSNRMMKRNKKRSKSSKTKKTKMARRSLRNRKQSRRSKKQQGGVLYTFDNTDMIGGLPAVKAISNCPPGVAATDSDWGIKNYEKFQGQKGGMNRDGLRLDVIQNLQEQDTRMASSNSKKNNKK